MRIVVLSQYFTPEHTVVVEPLAHGLAGRGHQVKVLTGFPNYPQGRLYDGYRQGWRRRETHGRVEVLRVPLFVDHSQRAVRRMANYVSFAVSAATARRFVRDADVVYVYATQMTPALGPWLTRLAGGTPYVLHVQDLWPDSIVGSSLVATGGASRAITTVLSPWLRSVYRRASAVVGIGPSMVETLRERGVPADRAHLVYNWADNVPDPSSLGGEEAAGDRAVTNVLYAGNVGDMQDLESAVAAAHAAVGSGVQLTIVGDGVALPRVRDLAERLGAANVTFVGRVPVEEMPAVYAEAHYALVSLKDLPAFRGTVPSKFQASLAHGLPVITSVGGDVRRLVDELAVGFTADPEDVGSLTKAFEAAAELRESERGAMARRARSAYDEHFSFGAGLQAVERLLAEAAPGRRRGWRARPPA
jgi:colanic acid biosynthesis glycosyl transferase WcaI